MNSKTIAKHCEVVVKLAFLYLLSAVPLSYGIDWAAFLPIALLGTIKLTSLESEVPSKAKSSTVKRKVEDGWTENQILAYEALVGRTLQLPKARIKSFVEGHGDAPYEEIITAALQAVRG